MTSQTSITDATSYVDTWHADFKSFLEFAMSGHCDDDTLRSSDEDSSECDMLRTSDEESSDDNTDDVDQCKNPKVDTSSEERKEKILSLNTAISRNHALHRADDADIESEIEPDSDSEIPGVIDEFETDSDNIDDLHKSDQISNINIDDNTKDSYQSDDIDVQKNIDNYNDGIDEYKDRKSFDSAAAVQLPERHPESACIQLPKKPKLYKCETCGKNYKHLFNLKEHMYTHTNEIPYTCEHCDKTFMHKRSYMRHKDLVHGSNQSTFICGLCNKVFKSRDNLKKHANTHKDILSYSGTRNKTNVSHSKSFRRNMESQRKESNEGDRERFTCEICEKILSSEGNLRIHMESHTGTQKFECGICQASFGREPDLRRHFYIHTGEKPYKCSLCPKAFRHPGELGRHKGWHRGDTTCKYCQKKFARKDEFLRHVRKHEEALGIQSDTSLQCQYCLIFLASKQALDSHVRNHIRSLENNNMSNMSKHTCDVCGLQTKTRGNLVRHCRNLHNINITKSRGVHIGNNEVDDKVPSSRDNELHRDDISTTALSVLDKENKNRMICEFCDESFIEKKSLHRHMKSQHQSGATKVIASIESSKQFQCDLCSKRLKTKQTLIEHVNFVHLQKFNFACDQCDKKFPKSRPLKAHIKKYH